MITVIYLLTQNIRFFNDACFENIPIKSTKKKSFSVTFRETAFHSKHFIFCKMHSFPTDIWQLTNVSNIYNVEEKCIFFCFLP